MQTRTLVTIYIYDADTNIGHNIYIYINEPYALNAIYIYFNRQCLIDCSIVISMPKSVMSKGSTCGQNCQRFFVMLFWLVALIAQ